PRRYRARRRAGEAGRGGFSRKRPDVANVREERTADEYGTRGRAPARHASTVLNSTSFGYTPLAARMSCWSALLRHRWLADYDVARLVRAAADRKARRPGRGRSPAREEWDRLATHLYEIGYSLSNLAHWPAGH